MISQNFLFEYEDKSRRVAYCLVPNSGLRLRLHQYARHVLHGSWGYSNGNKGLIRVRLQGSPAGAVDGEPDVLSWVRAIIDGDAVVRAACPWSAGDHFVAYLHRERRHFECCFSDNSEFVERFDVGLGLMLVLRSCMVRQRKGREYIRSRGQ